MILAGTGLDSFTDPADITTLYPFPGWEVLLVVVGLLLLLGWHIRQMRDENKEYDEALELYTRVGMERAMHFSGAARPVTDEDIEAVEAEGGEGQESARAKNRPGASPGADGGAKE